MVPTVVAVYILHLRLLEATNVVVVIVVFDVVDIFAGAARRAGPDSMLILCVCVYLRQFLGL